VAFSTSTAFSPTDAPALTLEEPEIGPAQRLLHLVQVERRPRVHGRIHVAEVPLVRRDLPVRMEIEAVQHQHQLILGEVNAGLKVR
jgi:hypothetical protein